LIPIDTSPASYIPGVSLVRGSLASEPVIPAGSGDAGSGANGSASAFFWSGLASAGFVGS
jgi:hypothetical protein